MKFRAVLILIFVFALLLGGAGAYLFFHCEHQWQDATCVGDEVCIRCGETRGKALGHHWQEATCTKEAQCSRCFLLQGEPLGHEYTKATCTEGALCIRCGELGEQALGHDWQEATCLLPKTCLRCEKSEGELADHQWQAADCERAKSCSLCEATEGEALGHDWQEATCLLPKTCLRCEKSEGELADHQWQKATCQRSETCSVCSLTRGGLGEHRFGEASCSSPASCKTCSLTRGEPLGHEWREATCSQAKSCSRCGDTDGAPLGHSYENTPDGTKRVCRRCGHTVGRKYVALTFDDGPSGQVTTSLLEGLKQRGVKATFFLCGYRIAIYPSLPKKILNYGHELGLHTDNHADLTRLDAKGVRQELEGMLGDLPSDAKVTLMRPPGGAHNATVRQVCAELGLSVIMWSVDPRDWETSSAATVTSRVVSAAYDGSIILMHDLRSSSVQGALGAIDQLQAQGYEFVTVSELAAIKGYSLQGGSVYHSFR